MANIWFTSDTHFGHGNIMKYCDRPFKSVDEMNETMITNWNSVVKPNDTVWHLGDFGFGNRNLGDYAKLLNGNIWLLQGNHDHYDRLYELEDSGVNISMSDYREITIGKHTICMFHYPIFSWNKKHHGAIHLYGHVHNNVPFDLGLGINAVNMCVEHWNYTPVSFEQILAVIKGREERHV